MHSPLLEHHFPRLNGNNYEITSPADSAYNCIAWAMGDSSRWWERLPASGYHWPSEVETNETLDGWMRVFVLDGYTECKTGELEDGFEKVAIYATEDGAPQHVARQLDSGKWTSKLGGLQDITHYSLDAIENKNYGTARFFMKRPRIQSKEDLSTSNR